MPGVDRDRLDDFVWWMCERQHIWRRRFVEEQDPPWTDDPILQEYHFCNVHRELDAGTQYYLDTIASANDQETILLNTIVYRFFNRPETMDVLNPPVTVSRWESEDITARLHIHEQSHPVFSSAYRVTTHEWADSLSKIDNIIYGVIRDDLLENWTRYVNSILNADSMEDAWEGLKEIRGIGDFLAYEIVTDLNYSVLPFSENDFVNIGPGAAKGLDYIFGQVEENDLRRLCQNIDHLFSEHGYTFPYWEEKPELTLRDIEHSLCELSTYVGIRDGTQSGRYFEPTQIQNTLDEF